MWRIVKEIYKMDNREKFIIAIIASLFTIIVKSIYDKIFIARKVNRQRKLLLNFIDDIILKYCEINIIEYDKVIINLNSFDAIHILESPMLNRHIMDYFTKEDLINIFAVANLKFTDFYHNLYEIEFLASNSPRVLNENHNFYVNNHVKLSLANVEIVFNQENVKNHFESCENCKDKMLSNIQNINLQKTHYLSLIEDFKMIRGKIQSGRLKFWFFRFLIC